MTEPRKYTCDYCGSYTKEHLVQWIGYNRGITWIPRSKVPKYAFSTPCPRERSV